jgi:cytochrome c oxidase assembly factor CtaG
MSPTLDAVLRSWPCDPWLVVALIVSGGLYTRGWLLLARRGSARFHEVQLVAFLAGLASVFLALGSPIEPFASLLIQVHMVQHVLLVMIAPPLLLLGAPLVPMLRGLPAGLRRLWLPPLVHSTWLRSFWRRLTHPAVALPVFVAVTWLWHIPALYELALRSSGWHYFQHACFLGAALVFWFPVVRPFPSRVNWSAWLLVPYLILADVQNTVLAALLTFSPRVLYPYYSQVPRIAGVSALEDQAIAGVIMWVPGSLAFLLPLGWLAVRLLAGSSQAEATPRIARHRPPVRPAIQLPIISPSAPARPFDMVRVPVLGRFLRWRHARLALQLPLLLLAALVIYDGLCGPRVSAMNLAGVLPWIHWRGLLVLGLVAVGNVACMACPFTLPRTLARRWLPAQARWPRRLRNKWPAIALLLVFLWAYEAFALWDRPAWTAWIAVAYFVAAFAVDGWFRDASFCKYVCPIGQFNFVQSLVSPLEVKVRDADVCVSCRTRECIRGTETISGCEMRLFQPRKTGNMDCTFCLDCVHACPHQNVGLLARLPASELWNDRLRSGIGRLEKRSDIAALVVILVFGAFVNAAGMVEPVVHWLDVAQRWLNHASPLVVVSIFNGLGLVVVPLLLVGAAAMACRRWGDSRTGSIQLAARYSYALVPLGLAMWTAHYSFHLLTSYATLIPAAQRFAADFGSTILGRPAWSCACCAAVADWIPRLEIIFLDVGLLMSLHVGYRIASADRQDRRKAMRIVFPWALLLMLLFAAGVWIVLQPMQMRGTLPGPS